MRIIPEVATTLPLRTGLGVLLTALAATAAGAAPPATDAGEHVYTTICQGCHMPGGVGAVGAGFYPRLAGDPTLASWQYVAVTVLNGRHGMPPFGGVRDLPAQISKMSSTLSDEEVASVVNYVRSHFGNDFKDRATVQDVAALPHPGDSGNGHAG